MEFDKLVENRELERKEVDMDKNDDIMNQKFNNFRLAVVLVNTIDYKPINGHYFYVNFHQTYLPIIDSQVVRLLRKLLTWFSECLYSRKRDFDSFFLKSELELWVAKISKLKNCA